MPAQDSFPPENYPSQKDYGELILHQRLIVAQAHDAFLHGDYLKAQECCTAMFDGAAAMMKLVSILLIERNARENERIRLQHRAKVQEEDDKTHQQRQQEYLKGLTEHKRIFETNLGDGTNLDPPKSN